MRDLAAETARADARAAEALKMRQGGATFDVIAAHYGVSRERARQYVHRGERKARKKVDLGGKPF